VKRGTGVIHQAEPEEVCFGPTPLLFDKAAQRPGDECYTRAMKRECDSAAVGFPRDFWLEDWEKQAIIGFHLKNPLEGYRRLTFMMLDADIVAVSPTSVWRVLIQAGLLSKWHVQPLPGFTEISFSPRTTCACSRLVC
jgi:hypothetical protein